MVINYKYTALGFVSQCNEAYNIIFMIYKSGFSTFIYDSCIRFGV